MSVSAVLVTRGNVDMTGILASLPAEWERIVVDNGDRSVRVFARSGSLATVYRHGEGDMSVYGRYYGCRFARHETIYVQDDDVIVSDPAAIVQTWYQKWACSCGATFLHETEGVRHYGEPRGEHNPLCSLHGDSPETGVVCNMPPEFRHEFYQDHALVGFGAAFHRELPGSVFNAYPIRTAFFERTCDVPFTALTPRVLVDVPVTNLEWATGDDRMYKQPEHQAERNEALRLALQIRDAVAA